MLPLVKLTLEDGLSIIVMLRLLVLFEIILLQDAAVVLFGQLGCRFLKRFLRLQLYLFLGTRALACASPLSLLLLLSQLLVCELFLPFIKRSLLQIVKKLLHCRFRLFLCRHWKLDVDVFHLDVLL